MAASLLRSKPSRDSIGVTIWCIKSRTAGPVRVKPAPAGAVHLGPTGETEAGTNEGRRSNDAIYSPMARAFGGSTRSHGLRGVADGGPAGRAGQSPNGQERRVANLRRRPRQHALLAARSDHRRQLQQAGGRVAPE